MMEHYILNDKNEAVPAHFMEWADWMETTRHDGKDRRRVARSEVNGYDISTVFLGLNHAYGEDGPPEIFETMVWDPAGKEVYLMRYATWDEAEAGHNAACHWVSQAAKAISYRFSHAHNPEKFEPELWVNEYKE